MIEEQTTSHNTDDNKPAAPNQGTRQKEQSGKLGVRRAQATGRPTTKIANLHEKNFSENPPRRRQKAEMRTKPGDRNKLESSDKKTEEHALRTRHKVHISRNRRKGARNQKPPKTAWDGSTEKPTTQPLRKTAARDLPKQGPRGGKGREKKTSPRDGASAGSDKNG